MASQPIQISRNTSSNQPPLSCSPPYTHSTPLRIINSNSRYVPPLQVYPSSENAAAPHRSSQLLKPTDLDNREQRNPSSELKFLNDAVSQLTTVLYSKCKEQQILFNSLREEISKMVDTMKKMCTKLTTEKIRPNKKQKSEDA